MFESVESVESAESVESLVAAEAALDGALAGGVCFADSGEAVARIEVLERLRRKTLALTVQCQGELGWSGVFGEDGHGSAKVMARHVGRLSGAEAAGRDRQARMSLHLPEIAEAVAAGELGVAQFDLLGRVWANRRVRALMVDAQGWFLEIAETMSYAAFEVAVRQWERLADMDGAAERNQRNHQRRNAALLHDGMDLGWQLKANFGSLQGASIADVFAHYVAAERLADWDQARAEHGDTVTEADLARTEPQRRADALWQICQDAAAADSSCVPPGFCHDIIWDAETYEAMLAVLDPNQPDTLTDIDVDSDGFCCETLDGVPLEPLEAAAGSFVDKMRRVVVDAAGTVIDLGRARCFTGSARKAAQLSSRRCCWPGCGVPTSQCQIDHTIDHAKGGLTNPANGAPFCGRHNRQKQQGFTARRDPTGTWHIHRPDQTEIK